MILSQISWLDIFVFLIFLAPQLILHVGLFGTLATGLKALPFLVIKLPLAFIWEQFLTRRHNQSPFVRQASYFEDFVIRCVRYAFSDIPANVGRVFFSKPVALPFLRFRMLRHGYWTSPIHWQEVSDGQLKGIWMIHDEMEDPDVVIFYAHGGGFSMGSSYFYLEFLLVWLSLLKSTGFENPAIFALEYTLVPDACYPIQLEEAVAGYNYALSAARDPARICVSGDSAGATIILSLLLHLARPSSVGDMPIRSQPPGMAVLISPWITLVSSKHRNTSSDYLDVDSLQLYAKLYAGEKTLLNDPAVSPGDCKDIKLWKRGSPQKGFLILFGREEVFASEIRDLILRLEKAGQRVEVDEADGGIHAWPVAALFLSGSSEKRLKGLKKIVQSIRGRMK